MIWPQSRFVRYLLIPFLAIWLVWFGLNKCFLYQSLKQYPITNPIPAVPLSDDYYRLKHQAGIKENVGRAATLQTRQEDEQKSKNPYLPQYGHSRIQNLSAQTDENIDREILTYWPDVLNGLGGTVWMVPAITDPIREGLKYCRIPFAHDVYGYTKTPPDPYDADLPHRYVNPASDDLLLRYHFQEGENPCIQYENLTVNWGGVSRIGVLRLPDMEQPFGKNRYYLTFPGYIYGHINNFNDYKEYVYTCLNTKGEKTANCKLLGYDQEMENFYHSRPFAKGHEYDYNNPFYKPNFFQSLLIGWLLWLSIKTFIQHRKSKQKESSS